MLILISILVVAAIGIGGSVLGVSYYKEREKYVRFQNPEFTDFAELQEGLHTLPDITKKSQISKVTGATIYIDGTEGTLVDLLLYPNINIIELEGFGRHGLEMEKERNEYRDKDTKVKKPAYVKTLKEVLPKVKELQRIVIGHNVGLDDLEILTECSQLEELEIRENMLRSLDGIEDATSLYAADVSDNEIADISVLEGNESLEYLYLQYNPVEDLSPLLTIKNLKAVCYIA